MTGHGAEEGLPDEVGPYRILERLGRGGMGVVYRGRHRESGEEAAVKTVSVPHEGLLQSLRREIHALARIRHPGVVRIVDQGIEGGVPWYAMELLEGRTLRQYCKELGTEAGAELPETRAEGADSAGEAAQRAGGEREVATGVLPAEVPGGLRGGGPGAAGPAAVVRQLAAGGALQPVLTLVRRLCAPLAFLHGEGIVHRDLKPANVLVLPGDRPVLVDFGLATQFTGEVSREVLEVGGPVVGTYVYMAPEQGRGELVDARADLYALGCILYELVTGRRPFLGATPMQILLQHSEAAPTPPSRLVDGVPSELEALILRLLAKQPRERLGHADDVAAALAALGAGNGLASAVRPRAYLYRPGLAGRTEVLRAFGRLLGEMAAAGRGGPTLGGTASAAGAGAQEQPGSGGLILIGGESGVGKTRLAMEVASAVQRRGRQVLVGECFPAGAAGQARGGPGAPLQALRGPLRAIADRCRDGGKAETQRLLGDRGKLLSLYESSLQGLPGQVETQDIASLPAEAARKRIFNYLAETLAAFASAETGPGQGGQQMPLLLVLDDLQWADDLTLGFLQFVLGSGHLEQIRLAIVGTYRTEEAVPGLQRLLESPRCRHVVLERLQEAGVGEMVCDMLAIAPAPAALVRFLARHTEGNPFFVAEYLRTAIAEGLLFRDGEGRWQVAESGAQHAAPEAAESVYDALPLPRSVLELVGRRLDGLSGAAQALAEAASVWGLESDEALLAGVAGSSGIERLEAVRELITRQVLREAEAGRLRFVHAKIREVAYARIPADRRRGLHQRAAEVLEQAFAGQKEKVLGALAQHWEQGGEPERSTPYHLAAARQGRDRYAWQAAEAHYRAYLRLAPGPSAETVRARLELGEEVFRAQGQSRQAIEEQSQALDQARSLGELELEGEVLGYLGNLYAYTGQVGPARASLEQALDLHRQAGNRRGEAIALNHMGNLDCDQGRIEEARPLYEQALSIFRQLGNRRSEGMVLGNLAAVHHEQGRIEEALLLYEQALSIHRQAGDRWHEGIALHNLGLLCREQGRNEEARLLYEQALPIYDQIGDRPSKGRTLAGLADLHASQGQIEQARLLFEQALSIQRQAGNRGGEGVVFRKLAQLYLNQGRIDEAQPLLEQALSIRREAGDRWGEGLVLDNLASLRHEQGRIDEARQMYQQALSIFREVGARRNEGMALGSLASLHHEQGRIDEARQSFEQALSILRQVGDREEEAISLCLQAALERTAAGQLDRAWQMALQADALLRQTGGKLSRALCLCEQGHLALAQGQSGRAWLEESGPLAAALAVLPQSKLGKALERLRRAVAAFEAGEPGRLFRGQLPEDLPRALRQHLIETGQLAPSEDG